MKLFAQIICGIIFATFGLVTAFGIEAGLVGLLDMLFQTRLMPRGLGWIALPIAAAIGGWKFGAKVPDHWYIVRTATILLRETKVGRVCITAFGLWSLFWTYKCYSYLHDGSFQDERYWSGFDWSLEDVGIYAGGLIAAPILAALAYAVISWIKSGK